MSIRDSLIKHLTSILRSSEGTILVQLCDLNGLSIAKIGRKSEIEIDPNQITSLASVAFSASEESWEDLNIENQIITFSFFNNLCLITTKINETLLTIVHDYFKEWPLDADGIASSIFYLKQNLSEFFGSGNENERDCETFSNKVRSAIYLFGMGTDVPHLSYLPPNHEKVKVLNVISNILDSIKNPIFIRYSLVSPSGLTFDAREAENQDLPVSIEAFSATANVAFQKMKEESEGSSIGDILCYIAISNPESDKFYGILTCPSGILKYSGGGDLSNIQEISFIGLFTLTYGGIPILGESRNIAYSIMQIIGKEQITENFINAVNVITSTKFS